MSAPGYPRKLRAKERRIIEMLEARRGHVVLYAEIIDDLWPLPPFGNRNLLAQYIFHIRRLRPDLRIVSAERAGYTLVKG